VVVSHSPSSPFSALVVDPSDHDRAVSVFALIGAGFRVSATGSYHEAKAWLVTHPPLVLVTEVRLGAFNGLQLALRAESMAPRITVVVTTGFEDPLLRREAEQAGATFALKPLTGDELLAAVYRTALRRPGPDTVREPIRAPFERRRAERRQTVAVDVDIERRQSDRRRDIASLLLRAASLS
jgi:DNA-binding NtrC family response regulator